MSQFTDHLMISREEEQRHLAGDIHDSLGQNLLALRIDVSMLHARTIGTHPRLNRKAATMLNHIDVALANVREIINRLQPPVLTLGLLASVEWKIGEFEKRHRIPCALRVNGQDNDYAPYDNRSLPIIRIVHEALTNVARHANASHIKIALSCTQQKLAMEIADDGAGILPDNLGKEGSFGLVWMRERIGAMGGELAINANERQKGTVLTVFIPQ
ncbi:MAG: histidine kinase [Burkholderiaceae bacterium]|nr:histidine kinase [Burkholderiaceae bacterium]